MTTAYIKKLNQSVDNKTNDSDNYKNKCI